MEKNTRHTRPKDELWEQLVENRRKAGIAQQVIADRLGVTQPIISRLERGGIERASAARLAEFLDRLTGWTEPVSGPLRTSAQEGRRLRDNARTRAYARARRQRDPDAARERDREKARRRRAEHPAEVLLYERSRKEYKRQWYLRRSRVPEDDPAGAHASSHDY